MDNSGSKFAIIHEVLSSEDNILSVKALCEIAGVSRSGYYNWLSAAQAREQREQRDREDFELILQAYCFRGYDKCARLIHMRLLHLTPPVVMNVKKIRHLMNKYQLFCPVRFNQNREKLLEGDPRKRQKLSEEMGHHRLTVTNIYTE